MQAIGEERQPRDSLQVRNLRRSNHYGQGKFHNRRELWLAAGIHQNAKPGSLQRYHAFGGQFFMGVAQKDEALRRNGSSAD